MADLIDESFEATINGGDGFDESGWTIGIAGNDANCDVDPDNSGPGSLPTGGGSQCLYIDNDTRGWNSSYAQWTYTGGDVTEYWGRLYVYILSQALADTEDCKLAFHNLNGLYSGPELYMDGSDLKWRYRYYDDTILYSAMCAAYTGGWTRLEWYHLAESASGADDGSYSFWVYDGTNNGLIDERIGDVGTHQKFTNGSSIKLQTDIRCEMFLYFDLLKISTDGKIGAEPGGGGNLLLLPSNLKGNLQALSGGLI